ncbi:hypothetical protein [Streptomyces spirodelae]|uniref:DNA primase n=1 Tax=Streptomyces spirodelae TaxID=2812904 RepID=A0ABS3WUX8_9ACTN|nr:hypothetical protein [Streptomyces spirodelae]MBO8186902.1 hypothetical protein [Streptomyces spirodelae]
MTDSCKTAVLAAVAGGYLLGRTRKAKLALTLGSVVAGRRLGLDPQELLRQGVRKLAETPQFEELTDQIKHQLMAAARTAASSTANRRLESLADSLRDRTARLGGEGGPDDENGGDDGDGDGDGGEKPQKRQEERQSSGEQRSSSGGDSSAGRPRRKPSTDRPAKKKPSGSTGERSSAGSQREKSADRSAAGGRRHG